VAYLRRWPDDDDGMNRSFRHLSFFFPFLLLGCGVEAPRPLLEPPPAAIAPPLSTLSVTLRIPQAEIARLVDKASAAEIADLKDQDVKCPFGHCSLDLSAVRTGPADVSAAGEMLSVRLPFRVNAAFRASGFLSFAKAQGDAQGIATATTALSIERDWTLRSQSSGQIALSDAHLSVGPLITNVRELWDESGESPAKPVWRNLDAAIARFPLKPRIETLWARAFTPIAVSYAPRAWLVLRPEKIGLMQPKIGDGALTLSLALAARGQILVQDNVPANLPTSLPDLVPLAQPSERFSVAVPFLLSYARAEQIALGVLTRHPPRVAGMRLNFRTLHILPSAADMVVETRFCADPDWDVTGWFGSCAHVYFRGQPLFDPAARKFRVVNLHYDVASLNLMGRVLRVFAARPLADLIGQTLVFDQSQPIARLENNVRMELAKSHGQLFSISADVQSFGTPSFAWTKDSFVALFSATGTVRAAFRL
jgi:hypothetical protein